jgi:hypothetical protein
MENPFFVANVDYDIYRQEDDGTNIPFPLDRTYTPEQKKSLCAILNQVYQEGRTSLRSDWHRFSDKEVPMDDTDILVYNEVTGNLWLYQGFLKEAYDNWESQWTHWAFIKIDLPISKEEEKRKAIQEAEGALDNMKVIHNYLLSLNHEHLENTVFADRLQKAKVTFDRLLAISRSEISKK